MTTVVDLQDVKAMRRFVVALAATLLTVGCAAPQQAEIPPSPTGCYAVNRGVSLYGIIPLTSARYVPAPCNVINANEPIVVPGSNSMTCIGNSHFLGCQ